VKLNRNHYLLIGLVLVFLGLEFRLVDTFVLNEPISRVVRRQAPSPMGQTLSFAQDWMPAPQSMQLHSVQPPKFIGWVLLSVGSVLVLQSLAMRKPG
jgi:hypothetical protein